MNNTTEAKRQKAPNAPIDPIVSDQPIYMAYDQTEKNRKVEVFQGDSAYDDVREYARARAARVGREVIIFGPQSAVAKPPAATVVIEDFAGLPLAAE